MTEKKTYQWKKWLAFTGWVALGITVVVLLVSAIERNNRRNCTGIEVKIDGADRIFFVDESDLIKTIKNQYPKPESIPVASIALGKLEMILKRNVWIKDAQLFFDSKGTLHVHVSEREPVARIFTVDGNSFYLDSSATMVPLSDKFSPRVPVFTGFPAYRISTAEDSLLAHDIIAVSSFILKNEFWMAQIAQVDISAGRNFEIIPVVGNHTVVLGTADNYEAKFRKLMAFYKHVLAKTSMNKYQVINVSYEGQVVAVKKDKLARNADSVRAIQLMNNLEATVNRMILDSLKAVPDSAKPLINPITPSVKPLNQAKPENTPSKTVPVKTNPVKTINSKPGQPATLKKQ